MEPPASGSSVAQAEWRIKILDSQVPEEETLVLQLDINVTIRALKAQVSSELRVLGGGGRGVEG